uniref:IPT/TIG domain-containing protein n=1 Tax=Micromonas pusilla TaxID=38833 RepID=A0A7S0KFR1_MICPS|mmetsp:Transcript_12942/g.50625  ORF Transcript_12942/g.50625 Transcript_12942/m.50625 type:complete len:2401 (+) Transcript_12942:193-7395(+)
MAGARGSWLSGGGWRVLVLILAAILAPRGASGGVHLVAPGVADVAGSNVGVVIHGSNFFQHRDTACRFGGAKVPGEVLDNGRFACVPPPAPHGAGFVYVEVSMNGQDFQGGRDTLVFEYVVPGRMASIRPTGSDAGGGVVTHATADGGFAPASACTWFTTDARMNVTSEVLGSQLSRFVSSALLTCEAPALDPGLHRVAVARIDMSASVHEHDSSSSSDASRAFASWPSPASELRWNGTAGAWRGGAVVAARWIGSSGGSGFGFGFGFGSRHSCRFGTTSVVAAVDPGAGATDATATCVSPAGSPGSVRPLRLAPGLGLGGTSYGTASHAYAGVVVEDAVGSFEIHSGVGFGSARSASPRGASTTGSHRFVAVVGADFDPTRSRCVVGAGQGSATSVSSAHVVSSALMLCELPPRAPGAATIAAWTDDALEQSSTEQSPTVLYAVEGTVSGLALEHADGIVWTEATPVGSSFGGDVVRLRGFGFVDGDGSAVGVRFGTIAPVRAGWISRDAVRTIAPAGAPGRTVHVALDSFASRPSLTSALFAYANPGGLSECVSSPSIVPVTGEVRIELASWGGTLFGSIRASRCAVGDAEPRLGCVAPAAKPGFAAVWVRGFDPDGGGRPPVVNVVARPHVASLSPRTGFDAGGFLVSARGGDFVEALGAASDGLTSECVFGSVGVEARFVSTALVLCESPPAASTGAVTVEIAAGRGVAASQSEMIMTYTSTMRVDRVAPARGPTEGGNVLTVYGANFVAIEPTACKIGTIGPLDARDNDANKGLDATAGLECVAPAAELGAYLVSVGIRTAGYTGDDVRYEYENAKHVAAIVPSGGSSRVATPVSLYGATIRVGSSSDDCVVGTVRVPGVVVFAGEVRCELPAGTFRGFVAVGVGGLRADSLDVVVYEFKTPVQAIGAYPRSGYVYGGSVTFVASRHAVGANVGCAVGDDAGQAGPHISSALVACETPGGDVAGELGLTLLDGPPLGAPAGDGEAAYRYRAEEIVRGVEPEAATAAGGVAVLVATGSLNPDSLSLACAFGTIAPVRARASDRPGFGLVECVAPNLDPSLAGAFVSVRLGVGCEFGRGGAALRIVSAPVDGIGVPTSVTDDDDEPREEEEDDVLAVMTSASPATGSSNGGTRLAVFGSNLARYSSNPVRFGDVAVVGHFVSSALVVVETPAVDYFGPTRLGDGDAAGDSAVQVFSNFAFSYVESARVDSVSPSVTHPSGGTALAIKGSFGRGVFYCRVGTIGPISASSVDAGTVECVAPARDEGAAVVTVASGFGDVHGRGEASLAYELPRVKKADEDKPPEPEVAAVVPFAGPLGGGSPVYVVGKELTALASSFIEFGGAMAPSHAVSSALVIVEAPPGSHLGSVAVHGTEGLSGRFAYVEDVDEFTAEPAVVGIDGGATITLVGASLGSGRTARTACRIGTLGPIAASYAGGYRFECRAPATVPGTRTVAAGTHDGTAWTAGGSLLATHAPRGVFASPPATPSGTDVVPAAVSFFGLWLHAPKPGGFESPSVSFVDAGSDSRFVAVRIDHSRHPSALSFDNNPGVHAFVERFAAPKVRSVASFGGGIEGGSLAYVFGGDFDDFNSASCVFASRSHGFDVLPASAVSVAADVVSGALIRCETPALVDGMAANMFGYGGGDASLHVMHRGGLAVSPTAVAWSAQPTPWIKETYPAGGSASGGTVLRVTAAGAVESIQSRQSRGVGTVGVHQGKRAAAACAFGSIGPVATREGGAFTDVECVVPAGLGAVDVRIFSQRSACLPRSPRAAPNGGVGAFAYATEGRVYDALPGSFGPGFGRTGSEVAVLGVGLTLPRGAAVACLVDGDATRALSATSSSAVNCDVPPGPSGFVVVAVSDAAGSVQLTRSQSPRTYAASPSAVDAGGGGVLSLHGVDMHRAVGFTFGGDDGAMVSSALGVVVSSALAVVEAPGAEKVVNQPAGSVVAVAVGATRGGPIGYDAAGPAPPSSASVWLTTPRAIERVSPASGPAGGGQAVSFSLFPKLAGGAGSDGDVPGAAAAECWFGTFGPVRGRDDGAGGIECVTVAHVPGSVETHAAARPDASAGGYARRSPAIGGFAEISKDAFENAEIPNVSGYSFFASRFDRDGLSATLLLSVSVVSRAGRLELAVPFDYDGGVSLDGVAGPLAIETSPRGRGAFGVATVKIPPFSNRGGFFALSLAAGGAGDAAKPFGQVRVVPAPELGSANPSLQPKDGGGVLWIVGSNLGPEVESELVVVVASSSYPPSAPFPIELSPRVLAPSSEAKAPGGFDPNPDPNPEADPRCRRNTSRLRLAPASSSASRIRSSTVMSLDPNPDTSPSPIAWNSSYATTPTAMDRLRLVEPLAPVYLFLGDDALPLPDDALPDDVAIMTPRFARASSSFVNPVASLPNTTATLVPFAA